MSKNNIFENDIDVPEVVQKKADVAFSKLEKDGVVIINQKLGSKVTRMIKPIIAVAASAAVLVGVGASQHIIKNMNSTHTEENTDVVASIDKMFTLNVCAAELEKGHEIPAMNGNSNGGGMSGDEDGTVHYTINLPMVCTGENIDSITYSINKGIFQVQDYGEGVVIDGEEYEGEGLSGCITGKGKKGQETNFDYGIVKQYKSFTVSYDNQPSNDTIISLCNKVKLAPEEEQYLFTESELEDRAESQRKLIDGVVITATIHYTDGTSEDANVKIGVKIMSNAEAGIPTKGEWTKPFYTFELQ